MGGGEAQRSGQNIKVYHDILFSNCQVYTACHFHKPANLIKNSRLKNKTTRLFKANATSLLVL